VCRSLCGPVVPERPEIVHRQGHTVASSPSRGVRHAGSDPAVTLHVYSPPLLRMGAYVIGEDGVLARHPMSRRDELRPLERAR
jgi:hypothetical protein